MVIPLTLSTESFKLLASSCSIYWPKEPVADRAPGIVDADFYPSLSCTTLQAFTSNKSQVTSCTIPECCC